MVRWKRYWWEWLFLKPTVLLGLLTGLVAPMRVLALDSGAGLRRVAVVRDAALGDRWVLVVDALHPERPMRLVQMGVNADADVALDARVAATVGAVVVHAGERVRLWREDGLARIETMGVSEASAAVGARVAVRLIRQMGASNDAASRVIGVVRGPGSVEILR